MDNLTGLISIASKLLIKMHCIRTNNEDRLTTNAAKQDCLDQRISSVRFRYGPLFWEHFSPKGPALLPGHLAALPLLFLTRR